MTNAQHPEYNRDHRKIIHIDMDAFYAAVEQRDHPELRGKPIAIGSAGQRGVVATASYEARKFGVHSAMPSVTALKRCPELIFVHGNFEKYKAVSMQLRQIFFDYTPLVEPLSLDEAYLDVTQNNASNPSATLLAKEIKQRILDETHLTASAGVSFNKFLAKTASDINKPNGLFVITPDMSDHFIDKLKIEKFFGIGKVTAQKFHQMGVFFGADLKKLSQRRLTNEFGKAGIYYYNIARGIDERAVNPERERKSVGTENTFLTDLTDSVEMAAEIKHLAQVTHERLIKTGRYGRTITLKIKFHDFTQITRSITLPQAIQDEKTMNDTAQELLAHYYEPNWKVRLLGITISNFLNEEQEAIQLTINWNGIPDDESKPHR